MHVLLLLIALITAGCAHVDQGGGDVATPSIQLADEGTFKGTPYRLNCIGASVTCAVSAGVGTVTVSAGASPLTTKGDLYTFTSVDARLPVGTDGQTLQADSSTATGLKWNTVAAGGVNKVTGAVDFGATPSVGTTTASVTIVATGLTATSNVQCSIGPGTSAHPELVGAQINDDVAMEEVTVAGYSRSTNQIIVLAHAPKTSYGTYNIYCMY